jgi:hypothetical protein
MIIEYILTKKRRLGANFIFLLHTLNFYVFIGITILYLINAILFHWWPFIIFLVVLFGFGIYLNLISEKQNIMNRNLYLPVKIIFSDSEVNIETPVSRETLKWNAFVAWRKNRWFYFLYSSSQSFISIPKSVIANNDFVTLESILSRNIKSK